MMGRTTKNKVATVQTGIHLEPTNFRMAVDYRTDESKDCEEGGCDSICRCSRIDRAWLVAVSGVDPTDLKLVERSDPEKRGQVYHPTRLEYYCLQRLMVLHNCYDLEGYDIVTGGGWYGQEVSEVTLKAHDSLAQYVTDLFRQPSDHAKLMFVLNLEYGHIAEILRDTNDVEIVELELSKVQPSNGALMLKRQKDYLYKLQDETIVGITMSGLLLDGNHRYSFLISTKGPSYKAVYFNLFRSLAGSVIEQPMLEAPCP